MPLLTEIQKLLDGERGRWKSGVILDFGVAVFQQRPEDPHIESFSDDVREKKLGEGGQMLGRYVSPRGGHISTGHGGGDDATRQSQLHKVTG